MIGATMTNYSKYSNRKQNNENKIEEATVETNTNEPIAETNIDEVETNEPENTIKDTVTVNCAFLNLRSDSNKESDVIRILENGTILEVLDRGDEWIKITFDGQTGYVMGKFVI